MDLKQVAKDTAKVLTSYFTYQALRTVLAQLSENDPPQALWLHSFSSRHSIQDGEAFLLGITSGEARIGFSDYDRPAASGGGSGRLLTGNGSH
jgi:hypothetical protein